VRLFFLFISSFLLIGCATKQNAPQLSYPNFRDDPQFIKLNSTCKSGNEFFCNQLGEYFYARFDYGNALKVFDYSCAKFKNANSCMRVGTMLENGEGIAPDKHNAQKVFRFLCFRGEEEACKKMAR